MLFVCVLPSGVWAPTRSPGRSESSSAPRWTVAGAVAALKGWAWREPFLRAARGAADGVDIGGVLRGRIPRVGDKSVKDWFDVSMTGVFSPPC